MSDKHTAAQEVFTVHTSTEDGNAISADFISYDAAHTFWIASGGTFPKLRRASEGQAQTSAAVQTDQLIELAECIQIELTREAIAATRTAASLLDAGEVRIGMELACDEIETRLASQLADSTAPGAAEHSFVITGDSINNEHGFFAVHGRGFTPAEQAAITAGITPEDWSKQFPSPSMTDSTEPSAPVDGETFASCMRAVKTAYQQGRKDEADSRAPGAQDSLEARTEDIRLRLANPTSIPSSTLLHYAECLLAHIAVLRSAPTAQQSLTAGGAVPVPYEDRSDPPGMCLPFWHRMSAELDEWRSRFSYAAPLPQVQSEALYWRDACESIIDIWDDAQKNPPESRCYLEGAWPALLNEIRADLAAQQAIKPSVDNDGGVE